MQLQHQFSSVLQNSSPLKVADILSENPSIAQWKEDLQTQGSILSEQKIKFELLQAGTTSVLTCLQNPIIRIENIKS
jgi:hypothetical protein